MSDCEWMFGDTATGKWGFNELAHLNPFRWSGSLEFEEAINRMQEALKVDGSRPVLVKVPSGVKTAHQRFETIGEGIVYLKQKDPRTLARKQDEHKIASEVLKAESAAKDAAEAAIATIREEVAAKEQMVVEAKDGLKRAKTHADTVQSELDCSWMFGDAAKGPIGFNELAKFNPLRWSANISIKEGISNLQEVQAKAPTREILLRVPGKTGTETHFQTVNEAIAYLERVCPHRTAANDALEEATAKLTTAEADLAGVQTKLVSATDSLSVAQLSLESAKKKAAETKAELDEATSAS